MSFIACAHLNVEVQIISLKECVAQEMETLGEEELQAVAEYVSFLKFHSRADSIAQWEQENAQMTPEQQADNTRIYAEFEREGIPRVRFWARNSPL